MSPEHDSEPRTPSTPSEPSRRAPISVERWRRIVGLVEVAIDLEPPLRGAYLETVTQKDPELKRQVHRMLRHFGMDGWLDVPTPEPGSGSQRALDAERIGPYRLLKVLGRGGMGVVYLADRRDQQFERQVAVKIIGAGQETPIVHQRFLSERQILARFDHPNIARLFEGGTTVDGRPFFVLEYVDGLPLDVHCETHHLTLEERLHLFFDVCSAVAYAHQNLVVHRDLKPSNILVDRDNKPKLLDFGIAKLLDPSAMPFELEPTRTTLRPMTPSYAAPEQIAGGQITTATDVYALGVLLYKILTGRLPFEISGQLPTEQILELQRKEPPRPSQVLANAQQEGIVPATWAGQDISKVIRHLRGDLDNIVRKALRFEPDQRYTSVSRFTDDLRRFEQGEPVTATRDTPLYSLKKFVLRYRWVVGGTLLVLVTLLSFALVTRRHAATAARERDKAEESARDARLTRDFLAGLLQVADGISQSDNKVPLDALLDQGLLRLQSGEVQNAAARVELFAVLAESYESLRNYRQAAFAWQQAAKLAEEQGRPGAELRHWHLKAAYAWQVTTDFPAALPELEAARRHSSPAEQLQIDLHLLDMDAHLEDNESFRRRANLLLGQLEDQPANDLIWASVLSTYVTIRDSQGATEEAAQLGERLLSLIERHGQDAAWQPLQQRHLGTMAKVHLHLGDLEKALVMTEWGIQLEDPGPGERFHAGLLLRRVDRARLYVLLDRDDKGEQEIRWIEGELAKLSALDAADPRIRFLTAKIHLLHAELALRRGQNPKEKAMAALELLEPLHRELGKTYVDFAYFRALMILDRRQEAEPLALSLAERGLRDPEFLQLAHAAGFHPEMKAVDWKIDLPPWMERRLASLAPKTSR